VVLTINVLLVGAEADPFAKVGGLADVAGSLPKALRQLGVDVRVLMPLYGFIDRQRFGIKPLFTIKLRRRTGITDVEVHTAEHDGVPFYFVRALPYFGADVTVYSDWDGDVPRFIFFNQAAMAVAMELKRRVGWFPDVFHVNDWHTGLIPFLLEESRHDPMWAMTGSILSIHNMAYQGEHVGGWLWELGVPGRHHPELVRRGLTDNMLAMAIAYTDIVSTVSPTYAVEIQYPPQGYGLDGLIRTRLSDLRGIVNGIDVDQWNPETDPKLVVNYNAANFAQKRILDKRQLQADSNLPIRDDVPLVGLVSRLVWQKGIDLAIPALRALLAQDPDVQFIALGTGEPELNRLLFDLGEDFPGRASVFLGYNATVAQRIYGGADIFLMPSRYEPCGVGQMLAMRYGALPLVRETGGLADTVENYDGGPGERGTGFTFLWEEPEAILGTLGWALTTYRERHEAWLKMQKRAMETDFSWDKSARQYVDLYQRAIIKRKG
jgi:starch synthase